MACVGTSNAAQRMENTHSAKSLRLLIWHREHESYNWPLVAVKDSRRYQRFTSHGLGHNILQFCIPHSRYDCVKPDHDEQATVSTISRAGVYHPFRNAKPPP